MDGTGTAAQMVSNDKDTTIIAFTQQQYRKMDEILARIREEAFDGIQGMTPGREYSLRQIVTMAHELEAAMHQGVITHE